MTDEAEIRVDLGRPIRAEAGPGATVGDAAIAEARPRMGGSHVFKPRPTWADRARIEAERQAAGIAEARRAEAARVEANTVAMIELTATLRELIALNRSPDR